MTASRVTRWVVEVKYTGPHRAVDLESDQPPSSFAGPAVGIPDWLKSLGATVVLMDLSGTGQMIAEHCVRNGIRVFGYRPREVHHL